MGRGVLKTFTVLHKMLRHFFLSIIKSLRLTDRQNVIFICVRSLDEKLFYLSVLVLTNHPYTFLSIIQFIIQASPSTMNQSQAANPEDQSRIMSSSEIIRS